MLRFMATINASPYSLSQLTADAKSRFPKVASVNILQGSPDRLAIYFNDADIPAQNAVTAWVTAVGLYSVSHPTPEELDDTSSQNVQALLARAVAALASNQTFLAIGSPTNAQVLAQVQALTKQVDALGRLIAGQTDSITGT